MLCAIVLLSAAAAGAERKSVDATGFIDLRRADCGIQRAIDSVGDGGGVVVLPKGRFPLRRYLYLRSGVTLRGHRRRTVLTLGPPEQRRAVSAAVEKGSRRIGVESGLGGLKGGMIVHVWRRGARTHNAHLRALDVSAVEGRTIVLKTPCPYPLRPSDRSHVSWGKTTRLKAHAAKGARAIRVEHPDILPPGSALKLKGKGDMWDHHFNVVTSSAGEVLTLDRPLTVDGKAGTLVYQAHCAITADGQKDIGVADLRIEGWADDRRPPWGGFRLAAIHTVRCHGITIRGVDIERWPGDGVSIQAGSRAVVADSSAARCRGHGFHPGTGFRGAEFTALRSVHNTGDGLYYCWHNVGVNVRGCVLRANAGHGIGGLGNPGDRDNVVEGNTIESNGLAGVEVNGGKVSRNVIRGNTIRNNSASSPGRWPGVLLRAAVEDARAVTVEANVIESTLAEPTQWVGVWEQCGIYRGKPTVADENTVRHNTFRGHRKADVIVVGPRTIVECPGAKVIRQPAAD